MGIFDDLFKSKPDPDLRQYSGAIPGGKQKQDGSHDHRTNTGGDRTPAQKEGDKKRQRD
jgi:hypothetical protein